MWPKENYFGILNKFSKKKGFSNYLFKLDFLLKDELFILLWTILMVWKCGLLEPWIFPFPYPVSYRFMQNYPRLLNPMQQKQKKKIYIFTILGSKEKSLENFTFDLDVPKSIPLGEDEE